MKPSSAFRHITALQKTQQIVSMPIRTVTNNMNHKKVFERVEVQQNLTKMLKNTAVFSPKKSEAELKKDTIFNEPAWKPEKAPEKVVREYKPVKDFQQSFVEIIVRLANTHENTPGL